MRLNCPPIRSWLALTLGRAAPQTDSQRRYVRILQSAATALAGRGVSTAVAFVAVPLTVTYLGDERYGLWVTISTLLTWLTLADIGLGNGLVNAVAVADGQGRSDLAQGYVATTFWLLVVIAAVLGLALGLAWPWLDWNAWLNVASELGRAELGPALALAAGLALVNLPLAVSGRVLAAYQEGALANYWAAAGSLFSLVGLVIATQTRAGLPALVLGFTGAQTLVAALSALWLFGRHKAWLWPRLSSVRLSQSRRLMQTGIEFFLLQIAALVLFQTDNLVIARFVGPEAVTGYSIAYRLFGTLALLHSLALTPLWPAYAEAAARGDWAWIRRAFGRTLVGGMALVTAVVIGLGLLADPLIRVWTVGAVSASPELVWLMAAWAWLWAWGNTFAFLLNGLGRIRFQMIVGLILAVVNLTLSILWAQAYGVVGVIGATVVAYTVVIAWTVPLDAWRILRPGVSPASVAGAR